MKLSPRQERVLCLIAQGKTDKEIAAILSISCSTVGLHSGLAVKKLRAASRPHAVFIFFCAKPSRRKMVTIGNAS